MGAVEVDNWDLIHTPIPKLLLIWEKRIAFGNRELEFAKTPGQNRVFFCGKEDWHYDKSSMDKRQWVCLLSLYAF